MKKRVFALGSIFLISLLSGCAPAPQQDQSAVPPVLTHLDLSQKKVYIQKTKSSLRTYRELAEDLAQRQKPESFAVLGMETNNYIQLFVVPIIEDPEAIRNIETKLEIAKLQLLTGYIYLELDMVPMAEQYLDRMATDFGSDPSVLNATLGEPDLSYATIGDGVGALTQMVSRR